MSFDGTWQVVSGKLGTDSIPLPATTLRIAGDRYTVASAEGHDTGKLTWGGDQAQPTVDLIGMTGEHRGLTILALARVKGDQMQLCYAVDGGVRPPSFAVRPGSAVVTVRYRRVTRDPS